MVPDDFSGTNPRALALPVRERGNAMRKVLVGSAVYITMIAGIVWGAYAGFEALIGLGPVKASSQAVTQMGPLQRTSGKWTPVEIKREAAAPVAPPLPAYVARTPASHVVVAKKQAPVQVAERKPAKRIVAARRDYAPQDRQLFAYAPPEPPRFFGPFRF